MEAGERFSRCLLEQKNEEARNARRLRRRTLYLAILIQVLLLTLLILRPLFGAQPVPALVRFLPLPPYKGGGGHNEHVDRPRGHATSPITAVVRPIDLVRPQYHVDSHVATNAPDDAPDISAGCDDPACAGPGPGDPNGLIALDGRSNPFHPEPPPPPDPAPRHPVVVPPNIQEALLVSRVEPPYPPLARQTRQEGTVVIRAVIGKDGKVRSIEVVSGSILFARAAQEAILQWRYRPTLLRGEPVEVETLITVVFTLR